MRKIIIFIFFVVLSSVALAADKPWVFAGWDGGGWYPAIVPDPNVDGRVYLTSDVAGVWRSDDRGDHWYFINNGPLALIVPVLAVAPSDSNRLYVGSPGGMMRSDDAGGHWKVLESTKRLISFVRPDNCRSILVLKHDTNKLYVGSAQGAVFYSSNGGESWKQMGTPFGAKLPITSLQISVDEKYLFASSKLGVMRCDFSNNQWKKVLTSDKSNPVIDMVMSQKGSLFAAYGKKLAISQDLGNTWQYSDDIAKQAITRVDVSSDGAQIVVGSQAGYKGSMLLSTDGGKSWTNIVRHFNYDLKLDPTRAWMRDFASPEGLKFDPFKQNVIYLSDTWGVLRSDDDGQSWNEKINGAPNTSGSDLAVSSSGDVYVATMDDGILKSSDQGNSYTSLIPNGSIYSGGHMWRVLSLDRSPSKLVVSGFLWNEQLDRVFLLKEDSGSFEEISSGLPAQNPRVNTMWGTGYGRGLAVDPTNQSRLYLGIDGDDGGGLFISDDGGENWQRSEGQPGDLKILNGLVVNPVHPNQIYWGSCGRSGGVYESEDSGKNWRKSLSSLGCVFEVYAAADGTIYAAGTANGPVLYASHDSGHSWNLLKNFGAGSTAKAVAVNPDNPKEVFVGTVFWDEGAGGKIFYSKDGGQSWEDISANLPGNSGPVAMAIDTKNKLLYVLLYAGSVYKRSLSDL